MPPEVALTLPRKLSADCVFAALAYSTPEQPARPDSAEAGAPWPSHRLVPTGEAGKINGADVADRLLKQVAIP